MSFSLSTSVLEQYVCSQAAYIHAQVESVRLEERRREDEIFGQDQKPPPDHWLWKDEVCPGPQEGTNPTLVTGCHQGRGGRFQQPPPCQQTQLNSSREAFGFSANLVSPQGTKAVRYRVCLSSGLNRGVRADGRETWESFSAGR